MDTNWTIIFKSVQTTCRGNRVRKFHFKLIHSIVVTKKELFRFNIKSDNNYVYILRGSGFYRPYLFRVPVYKVLYSRGVTRITLINLNIEDLLFGTLPCSSTLTKKMSYTLLSLRYYIYKKKLQNDLHSPLLSNFVHTTSAVVKLKPERDLNP